MKLSIPRFNLHTQHPSSGIS